MHELACRIMHNGQIMTVMGMDESIYVYDDDVWVIRFDNQGNLVSVWNPTNDVLVRAS